MATGFDLIKNQLVSDLATQIWRLDGIRGSITHADIKRELDVSINLTHKMLLNAQKLEERIIVDVQDFDEGLILSAVSTVNRDNSTILRAIAQITSDQIPALDAAVQDVLAALDGVSAPAESAHEELLAAAITALTSLASTTQVRLGGAIDDILTTLDTHLGRVLETADELTAATLGGVDALVAGGITAQVTVTDVALAEIVDIGALARQQLHETHSVVLDNADATLSSSFSLIESITGSLDTVFNSAIAATAIVEEEQVLATRGITEVLQSLLVSNTTGTQSIVSTLGSSITSLLTGALALLSPTDAEAFSTQTAQALPQVAATDGLMERPAQEIERLLRMTKGRSRLGDLLTHVLGTAMLIFFRVDLLSKTIGRGDEYKLNAELPNALPDPVIIQSARQRGSITEQEYTLLMNNQGYGTTARRLMQSTAEALPTLDELAQFQWRGRLSIEQWREQMLRHGIHAEQLPHFESLLERIPPIGDIIHMAVREVFSPDIRAEFGLDEAFPPDVAVHAARQGLTREWAENYWAAHWSLPSPQQGFEMLHRGVIDDSQLDLLLRAQDVMPFWREAMKQIAFLPLTRIDVRRMFRLGVLDKTQVKKAYADLGYDDTNASLLAEFVEFEQDEQDVRAAGELKEASRATILAAFKRGLIDREEAFEALVEGDHSENAAAIYVSIAEVDIALAFRKEETDLALDQFRAGVKSFDDTMTRFGQLGLQGREHADAQTRLLRTQAQMRRLPTKADLDKFWSGGIIDESTYRNALATLGYEKIWIDRYVRLKSPSTETE